MDNRKEVVDAIADEIVSALSDAGRRLVTTNERRAVKSRLLALFSAVESSMHSEWFNVNKDDRWVRSAAEPIVELDLNRLREVAKKMYDTAPEPLKKMLDKIGQRRDVVSEAAVNTIRTMEDLQEAGIAEAYNATTAATPSEGAAMEELPAPRPEQKKSDVPKTEESPDVIKPPDQGKKAPVDQFSASIEKVPGLPGDARVQ